MSVTVGERRIVSVLVVDVAGSTTIAERLGPERSKFLFDEIVVLMREEVVRFGGTVAQFTGDGVLALFGAPVAHEDDSERAVRAGLAIRDAIGRYGQEVGPAYGIELQVRAGINTGPVVVPDHDAPPELLYNALGDTVNVAARLQAHGDLIVGEETARQLVGRFVLEPLGELELKGKSARTAAYHVTGEREQPAESLVTPLVGREPELAVLEDVLSELGAGRGAIVVLTGEPGIGKSRLKSEVRQRFREHVRFLEGHAVSYGSDIPYWPLRELLRDWLGLGVSDVEARVRLELRASLSALLGDGADDVYPFLAAMLGLPLEPELARRLSELSRDSVQHQTFDAVYRLVLALSRERPLCLVFEDLHWADEATAALLEQLLPASEEAVAVFLSFRPEGEHRALDLADRARRRYRHRYVELELKPLAADAARSLAVASAGAQLPEQVLTVLADRSGGNPFFLEEALRDLIERGVLRRRNGDLELADGDQVAVPMLVQEALQARLDRLPAVTRDVVTTAAVVGRTFGLPLLERLLDGDSLRPALSELQRLELIVEEHRQPAPEYRFRHGLVQEVAYRRLVEARRRSLHLRVGEALEELHRDSLEEVYGVLARHYSEAAEPQRAVEYLLKAGDAARVLGADDEALDLYSRALDVLEQTGGQAAARELLFKVALTRHLAFDFAGASDAYRRGFALDEPPPRRLEPTEQISILGFQFDHEIVPGHAYEDAGWAVCRNLFRGLLRLGADFEILPDLAAEVEIDDEGLTYRFRLRNDAYWSDGVPVTSADFAFAWRQMRQEDVATAFLLDDIAEMRALDELTLEVGMHEPRGYFLYLLAQPPLFPWPRHVCEQLGSAWHRADPLVGNGPFVLAKRQEGEVGLVLEASDAWAGPRGNVRRGVFGFGKDIADVASRWQEGEADVLEHFHGAPMPATAPAANVFAPPQALTLYLGFNAAKAPFDDVVVRRAVAHAIDRQTLVEEAELWMDPSATGGFIPPTLPGHSHRVAAEFDRERARELLAAAGHPRGVGLPEVTIVAPISFGAFAALQNQLAAIGLGTTTQAVRHAEMAVEVERADAWVWAWSADYPDPSGMMTMLDLIVSLDRDDELVRLLRDARSMRNRDERLRLYREAERLWIGERVALVPLAYGRDSTYVRPWVDGFWTNAVASASIAELVVRPEART